VRQRHVDERAGLADAPQLVERLGDVAAPGDHAAQEHFVDCVVAEGQPRARLRHQRHAITRRKRRSQRACCRARAPFEVDAHHHRDAACCIFSSC
jgi:hypothetical protein